MKTIGLCTKVLVMLAAAASVVYASDPVAVYARVDKVVLEPSQSAPEAIQLWGVFSLAKPDNRDDYLPPARGYLYFKLADDRATALNEWTDLQHVAGTGQVVSFGSRYALKARIRTPNERPEAPDPYTVSVGLTKVRSNTAYPPIHALIDFKN
jgi:hypothetical protein